MLSLQAKRSDWEESSHPLYTHYIVAGSSRGDTLVPVLHVGDIDRQYLELYCWSMSVPLQAKSVVNVRACRPAYAMCFEHDSVAST